MAPASGPTATYEVQQPSGVALITLSNAPVNALHPQGNGKARRFFAAAPVVVLVIVATATVAVMDSCGL